MTPGLTLYGRRIPWWQLALAGAGLYLLFRGGKAIATTLVGIRDRAKWSLGLYDAVGRVLPQLGPTSKAIIVAHGAFESGYGVGAGAKCNNIWNITTGKAWMDAGKPWCPGPDTEYLPDGTVVNIQQKWRSYPSTEAAVKDYWDFLGSRASLRAARDDLEAGDLSGFVYKLYSAKYFTLPADQYLSRMTGVLNKVQGYLS